MAAEDESTRELVGELRGRLDRFVERWQATLADRGLVPAAGVGEGLPTFRLTPAHPAGCAVDVLVEDARTIYLVLDSTAGDRGWVELFIDPRRQDLGLGQLFQVLENVAAGRIQKEVWARRRDGKLVAVTYRDQDRPGSRWQRWGRGGDEAPLTRQLLCRRTTEQFIAWDPLPPGR